jgi:hypothetical protein
MALRELDRLEAIAEKGRGIVAGGDKRSRLPDALEVQESERPGDRAAAAGGVAAQARRCVVDRLPPAAPDGLSSRPHRASR